MVLRRNGGAALIRPLPDVLVFLRWLFARERLPACWISPPAATSAGATSGAGSSVAGLLARAGVVVLLGGSWPVAAQILQDRPNIETEGCTNDGCHTAITERPVLHRPTAQGECLACHEYDSVQEHRFALVASSDELCWECHDLEFEDVAHQPVDEGQCMSCHDPHGSTSPPMLVQEISQGLCLTCHEPDVKAHVHGPVASQECTACHHPHTSPHEMLLVSPPTELCIACHREVDPADVDVGSRHEALDQECEACHHPHASDLEYQLRDVAPGLCLSCHDDLGQALEKANVVHKPVLGTGGCSTCHGAHRSTEPTLLLKPSADLCLDCHEEPVTTAQGRELPGLASQLKDDAHPHGPVRTGDCTACHAPHAGEHFRLLVESYPSDFYVPFEIERYELCFSCHDEDMVFEESGTDITGFRHGDRNLHWLHVNRKKGRTCRACHEVHASRRPFQMREAVPFGNAGWEMKIGYRQLETGGSCAPGCHRPLLYRRDAESTEVGRAPSNAPG
jgi:predicted CXXCH cytochrome family protein